MHGSVEIPSSRMEPITSPQRRQARVGKRKRPVPRSAADNRSRPENGTLPSRIKKTIESVATRGTPRKPVVAGPRTARTVFTAKSSRQAGAARRPVKTVLSKRTGLTTSQVKVQKRKRPAHRSTADNRSRPENRTLPSRITKQLKAGQHEEHRRKPVVDWSSHCAYYVHC